MGIKRGEAKEIIDNYFMQYPKVKDYMNLCVENARKKGFVETIMGRKRMLKDINSRNAVIRGYAERNAINAPIQGSAADQTKKAMVDLWKIVGVVPMIQIHDELNISVANETQVKEIKQIMESAVELHVPVKCEAKIGTNWGEIK